jgi:hypothetical protein
MPSRRFEEIVEQGRGRQVDTIQGRAPVLIRMTQDVLADYPAPQHLPVEDNDISLQDADGSLAFILGYSAVGGGDRV